MRPVLLLAALAPLALSGCVAAAVGAGAATGLYAAQERTIGEGIDDASASNEIKGRLMANGARRFNEVDVEVATSRALLTGRVDTPQDRVDAERIAWSVNRVAEVANEITIAPPGGFAANVNDEWITGRVRTRLIASPNVRSLNVNIETYDGVVYLMGLARSPEEVARAAEIASLVGGVNRVVSYMEVREAQPARQAAISQPVSSFGSSQPRPTPYDDGSGLLGGPEWN